MNNAQKNALFAAPEEPRRMGYVEVFSVTFAMTASVLLEVSGNHPGCEHLSGMTMFSIAIQ